MLEENILASTKKLLGFEEDYTAFDTDIMMYINSAFMSLHQLGVGPAAGYALSSGLETWPEFFGTYTDLQGVKTYIYLKVRLVFDPPSTSFVLEAIKAMISEYEWRINVQVDTEPLPLEG